MVKQKSKKIRLDELLVSRSLVGTPLEAERLIRAGLVWIQGVCHDKPGEMVVPELALDLRDPQRDVGRGTQKLRQAFQAFPISVQDKVCVDVGSCSGGFTQVLLEHGAAKVFAIDSAQGCLDWKLRNDSRVVAMEGQSAQKIDSLPERPQFAVVDVSLVSLQKILPAVCGWLAPHAQIVALLKPQYEASKAELPPGAVITDPAAHQKICDDFCSWAGTHGLKVEKMVDSPILGGSGNREFLVYLLPQNQQI